MRKHARENPRHLSNVKNISHDRFPVKRSLRKKTGQPGHRPRGESNVGTAAGVSGRTPGRGTAVGVPLKKERHNTTAVKCGRLLRNNFTKQSREKSPALTKKSPTEKGPDE